MLLLLPFTFAYPPSAAAAATSSRSATATWPLLLHAANDSLCCYCHTAPATACCHLATATACCHRLLLLLLPPCYCYCLLPLTPTATACRCLRASSYRSWESCLRMRAWWPWSTGAGRWAGKQAGRAWLAGWLAGCDICLGLQAVGCHSGAV